MADEQDRRVEARGAIAGSGMLTDPERIESLQAEAARRERAWRAPPKKGFSAVLSDRHADHEAGSPPAPGEAEKEAEHAEQGEGEPPEEAEAGAVPAEISGLADAPPPVRRAPPDPRMAALNRMLDQQAAGAADAPPQKRSSSRSSRAAKKKGRPA